MIKWEDQRGQAVFPGKMTGQHDREPPRQAAAKPERTASLRTGNHPPFREKPKGGYHDYHSK